VRRSKQAQLGAAPALWHMALAPEQWWLQQEPQTVPEWVAFRCSSQEEVEFGHEGDRGVLRHCGQLTAGER
jgi:hypothetical protein